MSKVSITIDLQMADFVGCDNNSTKSASVFDDSNRIHFFETFIYDTSSTHVRKSWIKTHDQFECFSTLRIVCKNINSLLNCYLN